MLPIRRLWTTTPVRNGLLFVFAMLVVFRVIAHIPVPGIDASAISNLVGGNQFLGLLNIFSGGTLKSFSVAALGVAPYITASIIFQLLAMIVPSLEEMQKEEQGRARINMWTRWLTVPLALLQAYSLVLLLEQQGQGRIFTGTGLATVVLAMVSMTAGTIFLMWLGELISEKKVGNGVSILIFAGIVAGLPTSLTQSLSVVDRGSLVTLILFAAAMVVTIFGVILIQEAVRNIPVQYARQVRGSRLAGGVASSIPLKLNMGGVIPIIFAISLILFPTVFAQFFLHAKTEQLRVLAEKTIALFQDQTFYGAVFFLLVFGFTYFYTSVVFHPDRVAENLQKQGGFIPGIRPGKPTADYLQWVTNRLLLAGALFLSIIAVLPIVVQQITNNATLIIGGTSILIVVSVVIECVKQVEAQLTMHEYEM